MTQSPPDRNTREFLPINKVLTFAPTEADAEAMVAALIRAGFTPDEIQIHHGEEGEQYIDADGSRRGFVSKMMRSYQRLSGVEARMLKEAEAALAAGFYLIGVQTDGGEDERMRARDAMDAHTTYTIYYCGKSTIMMLANWENHWENL